MWCRPLLMEIGRARLPVRFPGGADQGRYPSELQRLVTPTPQTLPASTGSATERTKAVPPPQGSLDPYRRWTPYDWAWRPSGRWHEIGGP